MTKGWGDLYLELEHTITEIDLELHQWQEDLDMMSFIGYNASFELWTNDDPPVRIDHTVTTEALVKAAGKEIRVMNYNSEGQRVQVGTAVIGPDGNIAAKIDKDVPGLTDVGTRAFSIGHDEMWRPRPSQRALSNPPFEGLNKPLTISGLELIQREADDAGLLAHRNHFRKIRNSIAEGMADVENHPFFKKEH